MKAMDFADELAQDLFGKIFSKLTEVQKRAIVLVAMKLAGRNEVDQSAKR